MQFSFSIDFSRNSKITYIFPAETLQSYRIHNPFNVIYRLKICLDKWSPTLQSTKSKVHLENQLKFIRKMKIIGCMDSGLPYKRLSSWACSSGIDTILRIFLMSSGEYSDLRRECTWTCASTMLVLQKSLWNVKNNVLYIHWNVITSTRGVFWVMQKVLGMFWAEHIVFLPSKLTERGFIIKISKWREMDLMRKTKQLSIYWRSQ